MPKATTTTTPPTHRTLFGAGAGLLASLSIATTARADGRLTPIAALHAELRTLGDRHLAMDEALVSMPDGPECDALQAAFDLVMRQSLAIHDKIVLLPAQNMEDASIQAVIAYYRADGINAYLEEDDLEQLSADIRMLLASILPVVTKTAKVDIDTLGWGEMRRLCEYWQAQRVAA